jgi:pimeloyl-CoA dehydrogenase
MHFEPNDEQVALRDTLARLLADQHDHETRRRIAASAPGASDALWQRLIDLGLTALPVPEAQGGLGGRGEDLLVALQEIGRSLLASPLLGSCIVPVAALKALHGEPAADLLAALAGGLQLAWAHDEPDGDGSARWVAMRARRDGDGWRLDGTKAAVHHGHSAARFLVSARIDGEPGDADGRALFLVEPGAAGLQARALRLIDDTPALALTLQGVAAQPLVLDSASAARAIDAALAAGITGVCAELLGGMEAALRLTIDYLGTRQQFGRAIGDNQALRHALADMLVGVEMARSMAIVAAVQLDRCAEPDALADIHRAKLVVARHARTLAESAVQLHGGIGMTEEYAVGNYLRRVLVLETCFGDADVHVHHIDAATAEPVAMPAS